MPVRMSTANVITLSRLPLLLLVVILLYLPWAWARFGALFLLPVLYLLDWFDGYVARQKNQVTDLGSVLDIALDRVVENVLWVVFAHQRLVPVWIPILFIVRSFVVDGMRGYALSRGLSAFGMMHSPWGRFLVASRFMRGLYGLAKGLAFGLLTFTSALETLGGHAPAEYAWAFWAAPIVVYLTVGLCVLRGVPVFWDITDILESAQPPKE